jgi:Concanavalin A-like lectin/glucanases superfamily/IPT/TIG domain
MKKRLVQVFIFAIITSSLFISCGGDDNGPAPVNPPTITSFTPTTGAEGTTVTITGTNFSATPSQNNVKFGSVQAAVSSSTATSITTTVPDGATTGNISVTVNNLTATSTTSFVIVEPTGPIASYSFTGNTNDESGNNRTGTVKGATLTTDRNNNPNAAYQFNGNNSIEIENTTGLNNANFSFSMWVRVTQLPGVGSSGQAVGLYGALSIGNAAGDQTIVLTNQYSGVATNTGFGAGSYLSTNPTTVATVNTGTLPPANTWVHVAVTRSNTDLRLFINGVLTSSTNVSAAPLYTTPVKFVIGARYNGTQGFVGAIDEVKVYNRVLTANQVSGLANQ